MNLSENIFCSLCHTTNIRKM
ncbi:MAG: hypothetical protein D6730_19320 [Bacteroidetes bacterium]|nr:MAG: hypothetical protein D6730_19320 [Bacteroidota bacterium]